MAEISTIARPYAEALFSAAREKAGAAGDWTPALDALAALVANRQVAEAISDPKLSDANRFALLSGMAGRALPGPVGELLKLLIENNRVSALPQVALQFHALKNADEGAADCIIESAFAMDPGEVASLVTALAKKFPFHLKPEVRVNPQLIGGVRVTVGDRVLDNSVRARLDAMQARLTA